MPAAEGRRETATGKRRRPTPAVRVRCEGCLEVLTLRHAWDVAGCSCGALLLSGRPRRPAVHWLGRPGGGWTELDDVDGPTADDPDRGPGAETDGERGEQTLAPARRLGFCA